MDEKRAVHDFWNKASCGEELYLAQTDKDSYLQQAEIRYTLEPFIKDFAEFDKFKDKKVLEIGVGLGADHQMFATGGALLTGIDLTERAIEHTRQRFQAFGLNSGLRVADAEHLPFDNDTFDLVYSWGVLHHSPNTQQAINEVYRVVRPGGEAKIMIYHTYSFVGFMLWLRYALFRMRPMTSLATIYSKHLESPGTKAYSVAEARELFKQFRALDIQTTLTHGDLLTSSAGQRHQGFALSLARLVWPRSIIRKFFPQYGLFMLITAKK